MDVFRLPAVRALAVAALAALFAACSAETPHLGGTTTETSVVTAPPRPPTPSLHVPAAPPPSPSAVPAQATAPPADPTAAAAGAYRAWMAEARQLHPYPQPIEAMWAVMICESSGDATVVAGAYHGLFQYSAETWGGTWNPYRSQPILDPRAQIFATAKAWQDGNRSWWGCAG